MSQTSPAAAEAAKPESLDDSAAAVSHNDGSAHISADQNLSFGQFRTPVEIFGGAVTEQLRRLV